jgi:hypothetical protein
MGRWLAGWLLFWTATWIVVAVSVAGLVTWLSAPRPPANVLDRFESIQLGMPFDGVAVYPLKQVFCFERTRLVARSTNEDDPPCYAQGSFVTPGQSDWIIYVGSDSKRDGKVVIKELCHVEIPLSRRVGQMMRKLIPALRRNDLVLPRTG